MYGGLIAVGEQRIVYFFSPAVQDHINNITNNGQAIHLHMDATFSVVPRAGGSYQLFTVHLREQSSVSA